jgi:pyrimidine deaminase RibD-like protein
MTGSKKERTFMEIALEEMRLSQSEHTDKADPMVGVVLVNKIGMELGRAHRGNFSAGDHAEFTIFEKLLSDQDPVGGTLYVTLEPCTKREAPKKACAQRIVEKGIARVLIGILDPNPEICGHGVEYLRKQGVKVDFFDEDLTEEIRIINKDFIAFMQNITHKKEASMIKTEKLEGPSHEEERSVPEAHVEDFSEEAVKRYLNYKIFRTPSLLRIYGPSSGNLNISLSGTSEMYQLWPALYFLGKIPMSLFQNIRLQQNALAELQKTEYRSIRSLGMVD